MNRPLGPNEKRIARLLTPELATVADLTADSGLPTHTVTAVLVTLWTARIADRLTLDDGDAVWKRGRRWDEVLGADLPPAHRFDSLSAAYAAGWRRPNTLQLKPGYRLGWARRGVSGGAVSVTAIWPADTRRAKLDGPRALAERVRCGRTDFDLFSLTDLRRADCCMGLPAPDPVPAGGPDPWE